MAKTLRSLIVCWSVALLLVGASCGRNDGSSSDQSQRDPTQSQRDPATLVCALLNQDGSCQSVALHIPCPNCAVDFRTSLDLRDSSYRQFVVPKDYATKLLQDLDDPRFAVQIDELASRTLNSEQFERGFAQIARLAARDGFHCRRIGQIPVCY